MKTLNAKRFAKIYFTFILMLFIYAFVTADESSTENPSETQQASATNQSDQIQADASFSALN